ncbi:hypothetical protein Patl_2021 [Paraglaciecola sp. T6c]|uniref:hypothetical protein n=1 Tax=Pseudoalteromonas atlantica (strain T6c / ATCC BAA-1087) TaxID=3042615 RepID=UPI00005C5F5D|nr:hypothetical protein [Paraglaciecola sp. T6c]ABG40539.1 hypothetical protein Patl_2021 [Paraglaciecola sp. T6c]
MANKVDIDNESVIEAIAQLKASDNYTVKALAECFGVSRAYLYKNFKKLLDKPGSNATEEKIKNAIKILREKTGLKVLTKKSVAEQAGISRTLLSRDYKHLHVYISGEQDVELKSLPLEETWKEKVRRLEGDIEKFKVRHELELNKQKESILTMLMVKDLKTFSAQETDHSLNKLQTQNDELKTLNRRQLNELATLRANLNDQKQQLSGGVLSKVKSHFKAKYDSISNTLTEKEVLKLFISAEKENLDKAIDACISSPPDAVLFLQPFLSCSHTEVPMHIKAKTIVIIESNLFLPKYYKNLTDSLPVTAIHAVVAQSIDLARARFFCRTTYGPNVFNDEFLKNLYDKICHPSLDDGFESVSYFSLNSALLAIK